jgi:hypothetical protein
MVHAGEGMDESLQCVVALFDNVLTIMPTKEFDVSVLAQTPSKCNMIMFLSNCFFRAGIFYLA